MQQVWIMQYGEPDVLQVQRAPDPDPGPGAVRIAVEAAGVNFADLMGRMGIYPDAPPAPYVPGYEVAGRVDALGRDVTGLAVGDPVLALTRFGGYSEAVCVPAAVVFKRPEALPVEQAAGLFVAGFTAYAALVEQARVRQGDHVLIHGAGGGVGLMAVDIARHLGATIYGTASAHKHDFLRERGVQHPIDYRNEDVRAAIMRLTDGRGVDVVLDSIGGASWMQSFRMLAPMGQMIVHGVSSLTPGKRRSLLSMARFALRTPWIAFNPVALANANRGVSGLNLGHLWDVYDLLRTGGDTLLAWAADGTLNVHVDRTFPLADAADAHRYIHARRNTGKVILTV
jgi:NADPH:quinone reductase-like Zn-dependent oxidoreductase